jgi:hypothetical protein
MSTIELIRSDECPNAPRARAELVRGLNEAGRPLRWSEWRIGDADLPAHTLGWGSPTVLVDGIAVGSGSATGAAACRVYRRPDGSLAGTPSAEAIREALGRSPGPSPRSAWKGALAVLPAVGVALLPKVACPACWPAYAAVLGSLGVGFLMDEAVLLPLTVAFLALTLALLWRGARKRGRYLPLGLAAIAAGLVGVGKFGLDHDPTMFAGVGMLMTASLWNAWPTTRMAGSGTPAAATGPELPACCQGEK